MRRTRRDFYVFISKYLEPSPLRYRGIVNIRSRAVRVAFMALLMRYFVGHVRYPIQAGFNTWGSSFCFGFTRNVVIVMRASFIDCLTCISSLLEYPKEPLVKGRLLGVALPPLGHVLGPKLHCFLAY